MMSSTMVSRRSAALLCLALVVAVSDAAFLLHHLTHDHPFQTQQQHDDVVALNAKTSNKKKKKSSGGGGGGLKGFGAPVSKSLGVETDRSKSARTFYDFLDKGGAGDNLSRCALGYFPLPGEEDDIKLRGIVALKDMKKGDVMIRIPYELAVNLGQEGADPTGPGVALLRDYCETLGTADDDKEGGAASTTTTTTSENKRAYFEMLPPFRGDDCLGTTDFFSDEALQAMQNPLVVEETIKRREKCYARFAMDINDSFPKWIDGTPVTEEHLQWAVWLITSRVLTVQGDAAAAGEEGNNNKSYRLLIPFLDMCNHDRSSPHVLTGRAAPGGELKVVAGAVVKEGDQINICYGGGQAGNDRFLQDYGFLDAGSSGSSSGSGSSDNTAYTMVAQQILGKRRILEGVGAGGLMLEADRERTLEQLRSTTMQQDEEKLLETETDPTTTSSSNSTTTMRAAYQYRLGVKKALSKFIVMQ
jgi:hypothetical protein